MSVDPGSSLTGRKSDLPLEGRTDEDLVLGWVASADPLAATTDEGGCPTCGFAGELLDGPETSVCPACLAEYPKATTWRKLVRCPHCNLAIGISDESVGKTIICSRCKCFIGGVSRAETRTGNVFSLGWVTQIPVWVWLGLGGWQLNKVMGAFVTPPTLARLLPYVGIFGFLVLACCRVWLWRTTGPQEADGPMPSARREDTCPIGEPT